MNIERQMAILGTAQKVLAALGELPDDDARRECVELVSGQQPTQQSTRLSPPREHQKFNRGWVGEAIVAAIESFGGAVFGPMQVSQAVTRSTGKEPCYTYVVQQLLALVREGHLVRPRQGQYRIKCAGAVAAA